MKRTERGFSLLELLIVVAIILIIATIAIPSLLRSRQTTNESAAVGDLRMVNSAEVTYSSANGQKYATLSELAAASLLDSRFSAGAGVAKLHGQLYVSDGAAITDPTSSAVVGGPTPSMYGITTNVDGNSARYDYATGSDALVRYNTKFPTGSGAFKPVG